MPREAPVTSAICPCSVICPSPLCESSQCCFQCFAVIDGHCLLIGIDTFVEPSQHFAWRTFYVMRDALLAEGLHGFYPTHRGIQLAYQCILDLGRITIGSDVGIMQHRNAGGLHGNVV